MKKFSVFLLIFLIFLFILKDIQLFHRIQDIKYDYNTSSAVPFISSKTVMLDHVNTYVMSPLSQLLESSVHVTTRFPWLTANQVSVFGVLVAVVSSRVVLSSSLVVRRLAIGIFLFRQFVDDLDGLVARVRMGLDRHVDISVTGTTGYAVDGLCDAIGFTLFLLAVYIGSLRRNKTKYKLLTDAELSTGHSVCHWSLLRDHVLFGFQMLVACVLWNRYIDAFHRTLESDVTPIKVQIFKSRLQWIIMWLWRCYGNAHQLMTFLLVSVWFNRSQQFLKTVHWLGFVAIFGLSFLTEIHLNDIENYLKTINK